MFPIICLKSALFLAAWLPCALPQFSSQIRALSCTPSLPLSSLFLFYTLFNRDILPKTLVLLFHYLELESVASAWKTFTSSSMTANWPVCSCINLSLMTWVLNPAHGSQHNLTRFRILSAILASPPEQLTEQIHGGFFFFLPYCRWWLSKSFAVTNMDYCF